MLDVSNTAVLDYKDYILHKCQSGAENVRDFITSENEAFLLGAYYNEWEPIFNLPFKLTVYVRHVEERLQKLKSQMEFWANKFTKSQDANQQFNYLKYCNYVLDNLMLEDEEVRKDLCLYLGQQYGKMLDIGFLNLLGNSIVFAKTASGSSFIGIIRSVNPNALILLKAHELRGFSGSLSDVIRFSAAEPETSYVILYDAVEIRPCTVEQLRHFIMRTGYTTYGTLAPVEETDNGSN